MVGKSRRMTNAEFFDAALISIASGVTANSQVATESMLADATFLAKKLLSVREAQTFDESSVSEEVLGSLRDLVEALEGDGVQSVIDCRDSARLLLAKFGILKS